MDIFTNTETYKLMIELEKHENLTESDSNVTSDSVKLKKLLSEFYTIFYDDNLLPFLSTKTKQLS